MKKSVLMSIGLSLAVIAWMLSGNLSNGKMNDEPVLKIVSEQAPEEGIIKPLMKVKTKHLKAQEISQEVIVQGNLEAKRILSLRAETQGLVKSLPIEKGAKVKQGELLFALEEGNRLAQIKSANSDIEAKEIEVKAMRRLKSKGLQAENQLKNALAALAAAKSSKKGLALDLSRTKIRAPFAGVLNERVAEIGSLIQLGDELGQLVDNSQMKAVAFVPQQQVAQLQLGQMVNLRFLDNAQLLGKLSYIAQVAQPGSRSFRIEAIVDNREDLLRAGMSVEMSIEVGKQMAHLISPALLTLDNRGQIGVKALDKERRVAFFPISLLKNDPKGIWVAKLPHEIEVISLGQNFVSNGEQVEVLEKKQSQVSNSSSSDESESLLNNKDGSL